MKTGIGRLALLAAFGALSICASAQADGSNRDELSKPDPYSAVAIGIGGSRRGQVCPIRLQDHWLHQRQ